MVNNNNTLLNDTLPPFFGASIENVIRQPFTALTVVMINERKNLSEATRYLYQKGGVSQFYNGSQGFFISWVMRSSHRVLTFGINEAMHRNNHSNASIAVATTAAEFATTSFGELVLTVAQSPNVKRPPLTLIKERYQREGFNSLTTGFFGNSLRNIIFNATLFGFKNNYPEQMAAHPILMSAAITTGSVTLSHPAEVLRARKVKEPKLTYLQVAVNIFRESSFVGFFKGLTPRMISVGSGTFVIMLTITQFTNGNIFRKE